MIQAQPTRPLQIFNMHKYQPDTFLENSMINLELILLNYKMQEPKRQYGYLMLKQMHNMLLGSEDGFLSTHIRVLWEMLQLTEIK